jgi:hypothetical protein
MTSLTCFQRSKKKKEIERTKEVTRVIMSFFFQSNEDRGGNEYTRVCINHSTRIARVNNELTPSLHHTNLVVD